MRAAAVIALELNAPDVQVSERPDSTIPPETILHEDHGWSREAFAEEQVRGLVRQLFSPAVSPPVQQVVFGPVESETDVRSLCAWVGNIVAEEKSVEVAVIDESETRRKEFVAATTDVEANRGNRSSLIRQFATMVRKNVWTFPSRRAFSDARQLSLCAYLSEVRREFEYSIVAAPAATISSKAVEMARFADGIVLVLSAQHTRRVAAVKVRDALSHARILGTVLMDREFPIPASLYRKL